MEEGAAEAGNTSGIDWGLLSRLPGFLGWRSSPHPDANGNRVVEFSKGLIELAGPGSRHGVNFEDLYQAVLPGDREEFRSIFRDFTTRYFSEAPPSSTNGSASTAAPCDTVLHDFRLLDDGGREIHVHETVSIQGDYLIGVVTDLTERTRIESEWQGGRIRLAEAEVVANVGTFDMDVRTGKGTWSDQFYRIFRMDSARPVNSYLDFWNLVHPDDQVKALEKFNRRAHSDEPVRIDARILLADGEVRHVEQRWIYRDHVDGQPTRLFGTCLDVTDRYVAQAEVRRARDLLQAVIDGIPDTIFVKDRDGAYTMINKAALDRHDTAPAEVLGRKDADFFPKDADTLAAADRRVLDEGITLTVSEELPLASGAKRVFLTTRVPLRDADEQVVGIIGIARDVTAERENERRTSEQAMLLDSARDAIIVRSLDHRVLYWNQGATKMYGLSPEQAVGADVRSLIYGDPADYEEAAAAAIRFGTWSGELAHRTESGERVISKTRIWPVHNNEGEPVSLMAINSDITVQKSLEQQVLQAQRTQSIGTLASGIAHDLNNALSPILVYTALLRKELMPDEAAVQDELSPQMLATLAGVDASALRAADLVDRLLMYARGSFSAREPLDLHQLLVNAVRTVDDTFLMSVELVSELADDLWAVEADGTQLQQLVLNLCLNARDAMSGEGVLRISASNVAASRELPEQFHEASAIDYCRLDVADTGTGIAPEVFDQIFDPFFTTKEIGQGTGLGLSSALTIVKAHGGFIHVESELGKGTRVSVFLPAVQLEVHAKDAAVRAAPPRGDGQTVLIVEDEWMLRVAVRMALTANGYSVLEAQDGIEAVDVFVAHRDKIAVVVTDMVMPRLGGRELIERLKALDPDVGIVASSGVRSPDMAEQALELGARAFVGKPYDFPRLLGTIGDIVADEG